MTEKNNKARLIILADMGNEPDEEQQMVHMLLCSNMFHLDGLLAVTGKYLRTSPLPHLFHDLIDAYEKVLPNLRLHAKGWHEPDYLRSITHAGQQSYGMDDVGEGKSSPGSNQIVTALTNQDPRPIYVVINAGSNTLAQAMWDLRAGCSSEELGDIVGKLRVFENGAQDDAGAWICHTFPEIHWIRSNNQTYALGGPQWEGDGNYGIGPYTWEPYEYSCLGQHHWDLEHIISNHGHLGCKYPIRIFGNGRLGFKEGGGTTPWIGLLNRGLYNPDFPWWGGWSGRFSREKVKNHWSRHADVREAEKKYTPFYVYHEVADTWIDPEAGVEWNNIHVPVWRWRRAIFNNQKCRADWCIKPLAHANHHPKAVFNGNLDDSIIMINASPGEKIPLDATGSSDPDGDEIRFTWWMYPEAGTYPETIEIPKKNEVSTNITIPENASGTEIHVILEISDVNHIASLYDYRRIVITVT